MNLLFNELIFKFNINFFFYLRIIDIRIYLSKYEFLYLNFIFTLNRVGNEPSEPSRAEPDFVLGSARSWLARLARENIVTYILNEFTKKTIGFVCYSISDNFIINLIRFKLIFALNDL